MPSFEARGTSRIIASERLDGYAPFPMGTLASGAGRHDEARRAPSSATAPDYAAGRKSGLSDGFQRGFQAGIAHAQAENEAGQKAAGGALAQRIESLVAAFAQRMQAIEREAADLVCAGTIGRTGLGAMLLGSTAQTLLRGTRRPILLVQPQER